MFTKANEADEDDVQNCESFAYDWIKSQQVQTSCSMSKDSCLFGLRLDGFQSVLMMCKIKRVMHGSDQGLDIVVTLILFQERLASRRT